jgi:N-methylhydantoinase A/oxoprolinase/acetone carboxylase beta subunit
MQYRVGIDVGGTFTDLVSVDEGGKVKLVKCPSTPRDSSVGVIDSVVKANIDMSEVPFLSHGSTVATNTVIENKGAKVAILTTKGFRDILEMRRGQRVVDKPSHVRPAMDLPQDYVGGCIMVRRLSRCRADGYRSRLRRWMKTQWEYRQELKDKGLRAVAVPTVSNRRMRIEQQN